MEFRVLGGIEAVVDDDSVPLGGPMLRRLLGALLIHRGRVVSVDRLIEVAWGEEPVSHRAGTTIRSYVSRLRLALGGGGAACLVSEPPGYRIDVTTERVDACRFEALVGVARDTPLAGDLLGACSRLDEALALWRGAAFAEFAHEDWARAEAARLDDLRIAAVETRAAARILVGDHSLVIGELERELRDHPLQETLWGLLMLALRRSGRQAECLAAYQRARHVLVDELGLEPGAELRRIEAWALGAGPVASTASSSSGPVPRQRLAEVTSPGALLHALEHRQPDAGRRRPPVGPRLPIPRRRLLGRQHELRRLEELIDGTTGVPTELRVGWILGEPGIGKTHLAAEVARRAAERGSVVLWGRCDDDVSFAYQPFVEAISALASGAGQEDLAGLLGPDPTAVAKVVPGLGARLGIAPIREEISPEATRSRVLAAIEGWLLGTALQAGLVLVIDDVQWGTDATQQVVSHLLRSRPRGDVTVVLTARSAEMSARLRGLAADSAASGRDEVVQLGGLDVATVQELVGGHERGQRIHELTAGNPLFVLALRDREGARPGGVAAAVDRLTRSLTDETRKTIAVAAVAGLEFDLRVVADAVGHSLADTLASVEEALRLGLIEESAVNSFRFQHAVVRDALRDALTETRRALVHLDLARAVELVHEGDIDQHVVQLAHHYGHAALAGLEKGRAVHYGRRAALQAAQRCAWDEALDHFEAALAFDPEPEGRIELRLEMARVRESVGDYVGAAADFRLVGVDAAELGLDDVFVAAAVECANMANHVGVGDDDLIQLLEAALPRASDAASRAEVLKHLGVAYVLAGRGPESVGPLREAVRLAERLPPSRQRADAFGALYYLDRSPARVLDRLRAADELASDAVVEDGRRGDPDLRWMQLPSALWMRVQTLVQLGRFAEAEADCRRLAEVGRARRVAFDRCGAAHSASMLALVRGDLDAAEEHAEAAYEFAGQLRGWDISGIHGVQMFSVRREQRRLAEVAPVLEVVARADSARIWLPGLAALYADLGRAADAAHQLAEIVGQDGSIRIADDERWLVSISYLADACWAARDRDRGRVLYQALEPWQDLTVTMSNVACYGPTSRYLGMLAGLMGEAELAEAHLSRAIEACVSQQAHLYEARSRLERARVRIGAGRDRAAASDLDRAEELAGRLGLVAVQAEIAAVEHRGDAAVASPAPRPGDGG